MPRKRSRERSPISRISRSGGWEEKVSEQDQEPELVSESKNGIFAALSRQAIIRLLHSPLCP